MEYTVSTNAKATADLKAEVGVAITKIEITLKEEQTKDNSSLIERLTIVQDATTSNQGEAKQFQIKVINAVSKGIERSNGPGQRLIISAPSGKYWSYGEKS